MTLAVFAALALFAATPDPNDPPPPAGQAAPATIDSLLDQIPLDEDAREAAVQAAFAAAQARRGRLDGRWRLSAPDGETLYILQLSDPGQSPDPRSITPRVPVIEGAWRDPRRAGAERRSGFLASVRREGGALIVRFDDADDTGRARIVTLRQKSGDAWAGVLEGEAAARPVVMSRF